MFNFMSKHGCLKVDEPRIIFEYLWPFAEEVKTTKKELVCLIIFFSRIGCSSYNIMDNLEFFFRMLKYKGLTFRTCQKELLPNSKAVIVQSQLSRKSSQEEFKKLLQYLNEEELTIKFT